MKDGFGYGIAILAIGISILITAWGVGDLHDKVNSLQQRVTNLEHQSDAYGENLNQINRILHTNGQ